MDRKGDIKKKKAIQQIRANEKSKLEWTKIKYAIGKPNMGAVTKVQKMINGEIVDITNVEDMNREIQEASRERFTLACQAPIQHSSIKDRAGSCGETNYACQLLTREVNIPRDADEATSSLIEEMADLWEKMCDRHIKPNHNSKQL